MTTTTSTATTALFEGTARAAIRIYLKPTRLNDYGQLYQVRLHDADNGRIIAHGTLDPEHAACRSLLRLGYSGYLEIWCADGNTLRSIIRDIAESARVRVRDDAKKGLRVRSVPQEIADVASSAENDNAIADPEAAVS